MTIRLRQWNQAISLAMAVLCIVNFALPACSFAQDRPRVIVLTDFFKDPDDKQSMIRFLSASNEFDVEGLVATSLAYGDGSVHPEWILELLKEYGKVLPNLQQHARKGDPYPSVATLAAVVKRGAPVIRKYTGRNKGFLVPYPPGARDSRSCEPAENWIGPDHDSAGSEHIIDVVDRDDRRPVWVVIWGGGMDLAQAVWKVRHDRMPDQAAAFIGKLRVYQVSWQDTGTVWLWNNEPNLFLIQSTEVHRGIYADGPKEMRNVAWVNANVRSNHGPLGAGYPDANIAGIKEGDTPSFLNLLSRGLSDPEHPEWGGWGGRFRRVDEDRNFFVDARDLHPSSSDTDRQIQWTVSRWNRAISNDFAARMDWCVKSYDEANHHPAVVVEGNESREVYRCEYFSGEKITFSASGTRDPDGDSLTYRWWQYAEAGTYPGEVEIEGDNTAEVTLTAPKVDSPQQLHLILEVTDDGKPPLTSYRRVVIKVEPGL